MDVAVDLVESEGASALTLSRVARELGVKPPSLYHHVGGLEDLVSDVALRAVEALGDRLVEAAMGRSGQDAIAAVATAFRTYAKEQPDLYAFSSRARPDDEEFARASERAVQPVLAILRGYDLADTESIHAARLLRSAIHGFVTLEQGGGFGLDVDVDESFEWLVEQLAHALGSPSLGHGR